MCTLFSFVFGRNERGVGVMVSDVRVGGIFCRSTWSFVDKAKFDEKLLIFGT